MKRLGPDEDYIKTAEDAFCVERLEDDAERRHRARMETEFRATGYWPAKEVETDMICSTVAEACKAALQAKSENLKGLYPSACIVLSDEVIRLKNALHAIAYPQRGTDEELWEIKAIAKFAGKFVEIEHDRTE